MDKRTILLGVTGSIAVYKAVYLARLLVSKRTNVYTLLTHSATQFVTPLTFRSITGFPAYFDLFGEDSPDPIEHIVLAKKAELVVVAPATAHFLGKLAHGLADDFLSTLLLATSAPVLLAPAMNTQMWLHPAVQENVEKLKGWGYLFIGPEEGALATESEGEGIGRMADPQRVVERIEQLFRSE